MNHTNEKNNSNRPVDMVPGVTTELDQQLASIRYIDGLRITISKFLSPTAILFVAVCTGRMFGDVMCPVCCGFNDTRISLHPGGNSILPGCIYVLLYVYICKAASVTILTENEPSPELERTQNVMGAPTAVVVLLEKFYPTRPASDGFGAFF